MVQPLTTTTTTSLSSTKLSQQELLPVPEELLHRRDNTWTTDSSSDSTSICSIATKGVCNITTTTPTSSTCTNIRRTRNLSSSPVHTTATIQNQLVVNKTMNSTTISNSRNNGRKKNDDIVPTTAATATSTNNGSSYSNSQQQRQYIHAATSFSSTSMTGGGTISHPSSPTRLITKITSTDVPSPGRISIGTSSIKRIIPHREDLLLHSSSMLDDYNNGTSNINNNNTTMLFMQPTDRIRNGNTLRELHPPLTTSSSMVGTVPSLSTSTSPPSSRNYINGGGFNESNNNNNNFNKKKTRHHSPVRKVQQPAQVQQQQQQKLSFMREVITSIDYVLFSTRLTWLLLFGPIAIFGKSTSLLKEHWLFLFAGLALIPCAERLSFITEQVATHTNSTIGSLVNATFGNAPELLISIAALKSGYYRVVQLVMLGSMLTNLMLVFGVACIIGGCKYQVQHIRQSSGNVSVILLLVATAGSLFPAALVLSGQFPNPELDTLHTEQSRYTSSTSTMNDNNMYNSSRIRNNSTVPSEEEVTLCRVNAFIMLILYICYLIFQLGTHKEEFDEYEEIQIQKLNTPRNIACEKFGQLLINCFSYINPTSIIQRCVCYFCNNQKPSCTNTTTSSSSLSPTLVLNNSNNNKHEMGNTSKYNKLHTQSLPIPEESTNTTDTDGFDEEKALLKTTGSSSRRKNGFNNVSDTDSTILRTLSSCQSPSTILPYNTPQQQPISSNPIVISPDYITDTPSSRQRRHYVSNSFNNKNNVVSVQDIPTRDSSSFQIVKSKSSDGQLLPDDIVYFTDEDDDDDNSSTASSEFDDNTYKNNTATVILDDNHDRNILRLYANAAATGTSLGHHSTTFIHDDTLSQGDNNSTCSQHRRTISTSSKKSIIIIDELHPVISTSEISLRVGIFWLFVMTLCISSLSDVIVETIDGFAIRMHLSQVFTSMVIIPFFSNFAEQVSAFIFAYRNEMDLCVGVTVGSAIQIATMVLPGSVLIGMALDRNMTLYFHTFETISLFFGVIVVAAILQGGTTNWLVGAMLVGIYVMFAAGIWFHEIEDLNVDIDSHYYTNSTGVIAVPVIDDVTR